MTWIEKSKHIKRLIVVYPVQYRFCLLISHQITAFVHWPQSQYTAARVAALRWITRLRDSVCKQQATKIIWATRVRFYIAGTWYRTVVKFRYLSASNREERNLKYSIFVTQNLINVQKMTKEKFGWILMFVDRDVFLLIDWTIVTASFPRYDFTETRWKCRHKVPWKPQRVVYHSRGCECKRR